VNVWNQNGLPVWNHQVLMFWNQQVFPTLGTKVYNQIKRIGSNSKSKHSINHFQTRYETKNLSHLQKISKQINETMKVLKHFKFIDQAKTKSLVFKSQIKLHIADWYQNKFIPLRKKT
jgi:hypothetical protein